MFFIVLLWKCAIVAGRDCFFFIFHLVFIMLINQNLG